MKSSEKVPSTAAKVSTSRKPAHKTASNAKSARKKKGGGPRVSLVTDGPSRKRRSFVATDRYPDSLVVTRSDIHALIDRTPHLGVMKMCALMVGVIKACESAADVNQKSGFKAQMDRRAIQLVEALPALNDDPELKRILKLIEAAVYSGAQGMNAAQNTAFELVSYAYRDLDDWDTPVHDFEALMKEAGLLDMLKALGEITS